MPFDHDQYITLSLTFLGIYQPLLGRQMQGNICVSLHLHWRALHMYVYVHEIQCYQI